MCLCRIFLEPSMISLQAHFFISIVCLGLEYEYHLYAERRGDPVIWTGRVIQSVPLIVEMYALGFDCK